MMIDLSTIHSLELIHNLQNLKSKHCLFGILNQTLTPMGARLLKSNVLQPLTELGELENRYDAVQELGHKEEVFYAVRQGTFWHSYHIVHACSNMNIALKGFVDVDRVLTTVCDFIDGREISSHPKITIIPSKPSIYYWEQCINNVIMLKQYVKSISPIYEALVTAESTLLSKIREVIPATLL